MILTFKTGKGSSDKVFRDFSKKVPNVKFCLYSHIELDKNHRGPIAKNSELMWPELIDTNPKDIDAIVFWGFMRSTKYLYHFAKKHNIDFYFIDHAYIYHKKHSIFRTVVNPNFFIRMVKNGFNLTTIADTDEKKLLKMKQSYPAGDELTVRPWKTDGKHILVFPPSVWLGRMLDVDTEKLLNDTIEILKKHTDRPIVIRRKKPGGTYNPISLEKQIDDSWAVVSWQTSSAVKAINRGVPSFLMKSGHSAAQPVSSIDLTKIEKPYYPDNRYEWLCSLCNNQWNRKHIVDGTSIKELGFYK